MGRRIVLLWINEQLNVNKSRNLKLVPGPYLNYRHSVLVLMAVVLSNESVGRSEARKWKSCMES